MASRDLRALVYDVEMKAHQLLERYKLEHESILIYCTYRSYEEQARRFRQGRPFAVIDDRAQELLHDWNRLDLADTLMNVGPQYGRKVTNAAPGQSFHNYGLAFDAVPVKDGGLIWEAKTKEELVLWNRYGEIGKELGLEWGGDFESLTDLPHLQAIDADWKRLIKGEKR